METVKESEITADQKSEAIRFWSAQQNNLHHRLYSVARSNELLRLYDDPRIIDEKFEKMVQENLGFKTNIRAIANERENVMKKDLLFWRGTYYLHDQQGNSTRLSIVRSDDHVSRIFCNGEIEDFTFENCRLVFEGENISGALTFTLPHADSLLDPDAQKLLSLISEGTSFLPTCEGFLSREEGEETSVMGKRDTFSKEGANSQIMDDPIEFWNGHYHLMLLKDGKAQYEGKTLTISGRTIDVTNPEIFLRIDEKDYSDGVRFGQNSLSWPDGRLLMKIDNSGTPILHGQIIEDGETTSFVCNLQRGFANEVPAMNKNGSTKKRLLGVAASDELIIESTSEVIFSDMHQVQLRAKGGTPPYRWQLLNGTLSENTDFFSDGLIRVNLEYREAASFRLEVQVEDSSPTKIQTTGFIEVEVDASQKNEELAIESEILPTVNSNEPFSHTFRARGMESSKSYTWAIAGNTPAGVEIDPNSGNMSGILTGVGLIEFTITLTDSTGFTVSEPFSLNINPLFNANAVGAPVLIPLFVDTAVGLLLAGIAAYFTYQSEGRSEDKKALHERVDLTLEYVDKMAEVLDRQMGYENYFQEGTREALLNNVDLIRESINSNKRRITDLAATRERIRNSVLDRLNKDFASLEAKFQSETDQAIKDQLEIERDTVERDRDDFNADMDRIDAEYMESLLV